MLCPDSQESVYYIFINFLTLFIFMYHLFIYHVLKIMKYNKTELNYPQREIVVLEQHKHYDTTKKKKKSYFKKHTHSKIVTKKHK